MRAEWTRRFLSRGNVAAAAPPSSRRLASPRASEDARLSSRKRSRSLPPLSVAVGAGVAALALTSSPDSTRRLRNIAHMGVLVLHESEVAPSFEDTTRWGKILSRGDLEDELVERLLSCIMCLQDDEQSQDTLRFLIEQGVLPLLVQYTAWHKPTEPKRLQRVWWLIF